MKASELAQAALDIQNQVAMLRHRQLAFAAKINEEISKLELKQDAILNELQKKSATEAQKIVFYITTEKA